MAAATAYCTSNTAFYQHPLVTTRSQFTPVLRRTTLSPSSSSSSIASISHIEQSLLTKTIKSDENNNDNHQIDNTTIVNINEVLYITSDDDTYDDDDDGDVNQAVDEIDKEQFLALVGLRLKTKKPAVSIQILRPLTKRLACPACLLPLPKYSERVRQALYIRLPFLKFLSITRDIEVFCSTDDNAKAQSLLPRSAAQTRSSTTLHKSPRKHKLSKSVFITMADNTVRNTTIESSMGKYVHSVLQCHVVLDRLEQSAIDQIMQISPENDDKNIVTIATSKPSPCKISPKTHRALSRATKETTTRTRTRTIVTTMTTEKLFLKRRSTPSELITQKRFKSADNGCALMTESDTKKESSSTLTYQRIYLKCFVCSKNECIDAQASNSDVLHSHWLEHDGDLSLNIYDSEIDSILTRVVEFFNVPKQHTLEGKIKTVFILNSKEIRRTLTSNLSSNDSYIVID